MVDDASSREEDLQWFRRFVSESRWRFAKTYSRKLPARVTRFRAGATARVSAAPFSASSGGAFLSRSGVRSERTLYIDERKYWHMGDAASEKVEERPTLINRTWLDVARYREHAKSLGYDDQQLDGLAARWEALLEKARRGR